MFSEGERLMIERLHAAVPGLSVEALGIIWNAIKVEVKRRLAVERKPVDLGFAKLIPVPYRQDWKELLISSGKAFHDEIGDPRLMAFDPSGEFILWSIECVPATDLLRSIDEHEHARKEKLGIEDYSDAIQCNARSEMLAAVEIINLHYNRSLTPAPQWRRRADDLRVLVREEGVGGRGRGRRLSPIQIRVIARDPNTVYQADKRTRSQPSSTRSQPSGMAPDPLPEEFPDGIAASSG